MKSLFWDIIPAKDIKDTIWDELDDTKIKINLDKFEEKFSQVKKRTKKSGSSEKESYKKRKKNIP